MRSVAGDIAYLIGKHTWHNVTVPTSRPLPHCTLSNSSETLQLGRLAHVVSHQRWGINILHGEGQRCYLSRIDCHLMGVYRRISQVVECATREREDVVMIMICTGMCRECYSGNEPLDPWGGPKTE